MGKITLIEFDYDIQVKFFSACYIHRFYTIVTCDCGYFVQL